MEKRKMWISAFVFAAVLIFSACAAKNERDSGVVRAEISRRQTSTDAAAPEQKENDGLLQADAGKAPAVPDKHPDAEPEKAAEEEQPVPAQPAGEEKTDAPAPEDYAADPEAQWQIELDCTELLHSDEKTQQVYGIDDTYAVIYTNSADDAFGFVGRVLLLDRRNGSVSELYDVLADENRVPIGTLTPVRIGERVLFGWREVYSTASRMNYCTIEDGAVRKCMPLSDCTYQGNGEFTSIIEVSANDIDFEINPELYMEHLAWGYHTYWYFWSEDALDLRAYSGIEITQEELAQLEGTVPTVQRFIQEMERNGYVFDTMYLRGNGILNVNFYAEREGYREYVCGTYRDSNGFFEPYPDEDSKLAPGRYEEAAKKAEYCDVVVFPRLAALRAAR